MRVFGETKRGPKVVVAFAAIMSFVTFVPGGSYADPPGNPVLGGGPAKSDCYVELDVKNATDIKNNKVVTCTDGDPCDTDGQCQGTCTFKVAVCPNQSTLAGCTPHPPVALSGKSITSGTLSSPADLSGTDCGTFKDVTVNVKGKKKNKPGKLVLHVKAKITGGKPKTDTDNVTLICKPRVGTCPPPTTTTTTTLTTVTTTTTTTLMCPAVSGTKLAFTTAVGTSSCGPAGLATPPAAPLSGELDSDTSCSTKIADLGLGCLCFGGGGATIVACGKIPDGATSLLDISGPGTLAGSTGTSSNDCTKGAGPGKHCANNNSVPACTSDGDCGGAAGSCALDANCFFGPPLPIVSPPPFAALTTCVLNVVQTNASGTFNGTTGDSNVSLPLSSRVYISGNTASPCPKCLSGHCDPTWKTNTNTTSPDTNAVCTPTGIQLTTTDCRPSLPGFQAPLPVNLTPLTTGTVSMTSATGMFCPQNNAGAFGQGNAQCIQETGMPAGSLSDGLPHNSNLASVFCIPATGNAAVDGVADLPGPGAIGLNGNAQLQ
jgi:hypothetical protein